MKSVHFVVNDKAVIIDIKQQGNLWEDFYDTLVAKERKAEPRESFEDVKKKILDRR